MKYKKASAVFLLLIVFSLACAGNAIAQLKIRPYRPGELLVKYKTGNQPLKRSALHDAGLVRKAHAIGNSQIHRVILEPGATVEQALEIYANDPDVEIAEPNYIIRPQAIPDDADFHLQWGLYNTGQVVSGYRGTPGIDMDAPPAWDITTDGTEVIVAVVDTGCDIRHPDLAPNIWINPGEIAGDGIDNDRNGYIDDMHGWDFANGDNNPYDTSGHGTHVAGIIAAAGNNKRGISGVAWHARIMPVRAMNGFDIGTTADAINAIEYAVDNGAKVINCSWGGANYSRALYYTIANADALFVCAAGNSGKDTDVTPYYPASYDNSNIISVAASDQMDQLTWFSNYGTISTDVAAPGARIYSLDNGRNVHWSDNFSDNLLDGWTTGGNNDEWKITNPPETAGAAVLASSPDGHYANNTDAWAQLPTQNLSAASGCLLTFRFKGSAEIHADFLSLEISTNGASWARLPLKIEGTIRGGGITGPMPYWTTALADLGPWDGQPQVYLRLRFYSDAATFDTGFFIDDINLTVAAGNDSYQFMHGTSMAAGYVSGLAALIVSKDPYLSAEEIKSIIENSVDLNQNLLERVASGGRVNVYNALTLLRELSLSANMYSSDRIRISWTVQTALTGPITIERRTDGDMDFSAIAQVEADIDNYVDHDVLSDAIYYYRIQAQTQEGDSRYSHQTLAGASYSSRESSSNSGSGGGGGCFINVLNFDAIGKSPW